MGDETREGSCKVVDWRALKWWGGGVKWEKNKWVFMGEMGDWVRKKGEGTLRETDVGRKVNEWTGKADFDGVSAAQMGVVKSF